MAPPRTIAARARDNAGCIALATLHGKGPLVAAALRSLDLHQTVADVDTNRFGTFTGDVPRPGPAESVVVDKARAAATSSGETSLGLASEGAFFPHPDVAMLTVNVELVAVVDLADGLTVVGRFSGPAPWAHSLVIDIDAAHGVLQRFDLPGHAVVVRSVDDVARFRSDIRTAEELGAACGELAGPEGRVRVESDLRADRCPSRHAGITAAAWDLAERLRSCCAACGEPGVGLEREERGRPCEWCGRPTLDTLRRVRVCPTCGAEDVELVDGPGPAGLCTACNP